MSPTSVTSAILSILEEQEPSTALSVGEIVERVSQRYDEQDRVPNDNEIRGRLTQLHKEGVVKRPERGQYMLVQTEPNETNDLVQLVDIVSEIVRPDALRRTVLWDASPYLQLAEDGGPGTRLVVEHEHASSFRDEVEVAWPADNPVATWTTKTTGPVGSMIWEPDGWAPYRTPVGIVFVEREKFGATGVTPRGYRAPFPERIVIEFLGDDGPAEATAIVQTMLNDPTVEFDRLWQAAESLGESVSLGIMLAGLGSELRSELRNAFVARLPPVVKSLIRGER
jgi:hypothetical protein